MKVTEIRVASELHGLQQAWEGLLPNSASNTIFLTWEWITAWWSAYGNPGDLRLMAAWDGDGTLRGIAPLRLQTLREYGQSVERYTFIGDGSNDSEYLDCIIAAGYEGAVREGFAAIGQRNLHRGESSRLSRSLRLRQTWPGSKDWRNRLE